MVGNFLLDSGRESQEKLKEVYYLMYVIEFIAPICLHMLALVGVSTIWPVRGKLGIMRYNVSKKRIITSTFDFCV